MAERSVCRPWTEQEDALLRVAVGHFGDQDRWKDVAMRVPNRTNKACRKRWLHSLSPSVKKCAWSPEEDRQLVALYEEHGSKWSLIARSIPGRTDDACSKRYRESLDPVLKKEAWTPEEDQQLLKVYAAIGSKWSQVGQDLGRGGLDCRNRWRLLERKRVSGRACPYGSPRQARSPNKSAVALEPSQSQESSSSGELAPLTPSASGLHISIQEPQDGYWPPLFQAELYPTSMESVPRTTSYAEAHSEALEYSYTQAARYQSSTSSLSAALSAPPAPSRPLPPDSTTYFAPPTPSYLSQSQPASQTTSPLFSTHVPHNGFYDDFTISLGDYSMDNMDQHNDSGFLDMDFSQTFDVQHQPLGMSALSFPNTDDSIFQSNVSPISPSDVPLPPTDALFFNDPLWKSPHLTALFSETSQYSGTPQYSPAPSTFGISSTASEALPLPELSSAASTPFPISASISPASPNTDIQGDLPNGPNLSDFSTAGVSPPGGGSLLFSSSDHQAPAKKKRRSAGKARPEPPATARLSSVLKLSEDPNVRPYACGHDGCWPSGQEASISCFQTSKELCDHHREAHEQIENCDKLFRCGLQGCDKSWKSVNGLQYHLQISTVHFKDAVQRRYEDDNSLQQISAPPGSAETAEGEGSDRRYPCTHPNCFKAYKQPSGLRYHMKHGHPTDLPVQLADVPPALERELPKKAKKMRFRKGTDDFSPSPAHPGAMAAAAGLAAAAAASLTPAPASAVPLPVNPGGLVFA